jgi:hypothetical protein
MEYISNRVDNENNDGAQIPPPPPYTTVIFKIDENEFDRIPPPSYSDIDNQSVVYVNNYPGPPLTDGHVQTGPDNTTVDHDTVISKQLRIYLIISGLITVIFGCSVVGLQIGIIASNSIVYYYYGFWGGILIIGIGLSTVILYKHRTANYVKLFHSFFWQMLLLAMLFGIGVVILLTDRCNDNGTDDSVTNVSCQNSYKILNGFLIGCFASVFVQSIVNSVVFGILKRQHLIVSNPFP